MIVIRNSQLQVFRQVAMQRFELDMQKHLTQYFPKQTALMEHESLFGHIRYAVERARSFGLSSERDVCKYLNLSMVYGRDFDANPDRVWMKEFLTDPQVPDPGERIGRLYKAVLQRLKAEANDQTMREEFARGI